MSGLKSVKFEMCGRRMAAIFIFPAIGTSGGMLEIVHARRTDDASLIYSLEQTDELVNPAWTNAEYSVVGTNTLSGPFEEMINQVSTDSDQSFFRLELKQN